MPTTAQTSVLFCTFLLAAPIGCGRRVDSGPSVEAGRSDPSSTAPTAATQRAPGPIPEHCSTAAGDHRWPVVADMPAGSSERAPSDDDTRGLVERVRRALAAVSLTSEVRQAYRECMLASYEHFVIRRVDAAEARDRLERFAKPGNFIVGDPYAVGTGPLWEVYWGGSSRRFVPHGPISGFVRDEDVVVIVHWPEG